jgi:hypothetical protein
MITLQDSLRQTPVSTSLNYEGVRLPVITSEGATISLRKGDKAPNPTTGKPRAEITIPREHGTFPEGVERWIGLTYRLNTKIASGTYVVQIHDAPPLEQPWTGWPSRPPVLALRHTTEGWFRRRSVWRWEYGADGERQRIEARGLEIGKPTRIVIGFRGFAGAGGWAQCYIDGYETGFSGPNAWKGAGASYLKAGLYCPPDTVNEMSVTISDLVVATTMEEALKWAA